MQAIVGYKETEKVQWSKPNAALMDRLRREMAEEKGEELETIQEIHVLDLAADGEIRPHIDSVKVGPYALKKAVTPAVCNSSW